MRFLPYIFMFIAITGCKTAAQKRAGRIAAENEWKTSSKTISGKCDTLILRQICDYCLGDSSYYYPHKFSPTTSCICYGYNAYFIEKINEFMVKRKDEIKVIIIENPSNILFQLKFKNLTKMQTLSIFGNDYNCDALKTFPDDLLALKTMKAIVVEGVRLPGKEITRLKKVYPDLNFIGTIEEYQEDWDQSK